MAIRPTVDPEFLAKVAEFYHQVIVMADGRGLFLDTFILTSTTEDNDDQEHVAEFVYDAGLERVEVNVYTRKSS